jgi:hypothetical protein
MSILYDLRARRAARRLFGEPAVADGRTGHGRPIVRIGADRLVYKHDGGDEYFRVILPCTECGLPTHVRSSRVRSRADLDGVARPEMLCHRCRANAEDASGDPALLRAKVARHHTS